MLFIYVSYVGFYSQQTWQLTSSQILCTLVHTWQIKLILIPSILNRIGVKKWRCCHLVVFLSIAAFSSLSRVRRFSLTELKTNSLTTVYVYNGKNLEAWLVNNSHSWLVRGRVTGIADWHWDLISRVFNDPVLEEQLKRTINNMLSYWETFCKLKDVVWHSETSTSTRSLPPGELFTLNWPQVWMWESDSRTFMKEFTNVVISYILELKCM